MSKDSETIAKEGTALKPGRPRCFCEETAVDAAMRVFWEKGYEGSSLTDLTEAMGINRPSLYAAFGDKQGLFRRAMERYSEGPAVYLQTALDQPTARGVFKALLNGAVTLLGDPANPRGCFTVQSALATSSEATPLKEAMADLRRQAETALERRLFRAQHEGELRNGTNVGDLTHYIAAILNGLGIQAANGATKAQLKRIADMAFASLPLKPIPRARPPVSISRN